MVPTNWKEQATEFMKNVDRVTECMDYIKQEVKAELGIEDLDGYPGGLLGALQKICDFKLEDISKGIETVDIEDDWREINRQHEQIKFLRMLVVVQMRAAVTANVGTLELLPSTDLNAAQIQRALDEIVPGYMR